MTTDKERERIREELIEQETTMFPSDMKKEELRKIFEESKDFVESGYFLHGHRGQGKNSKEDVKKTLTLYFRMWLEDLENGRIGQGTFDMRVFGALSGVSEEYRAEITREMEKETRGRK